MKALLVDDEPLARRELRRLLAAHPEVEVVGEAGSAREAERAIETIGPDLLFLDIQMPKLNGFEVLELVDERPSVVFVTAYDEYAVKAFELHAVDYLLKPFSKNRLDEALHHAKTYASWKRRPNLTKVVDEAQPKTGPADRLLIREGSKVHVVPTGKIDYIEAQDDYFSVKAEGKKYLKQGTLTNLEKELDPQQFLRIHRSCILNIDRLSKIEPYAKDSRVAILTDGTRLQVSRAGYAKLREKLGL